MPLKKQFINVPLGAGVNEGEGKDLLEPPFATTAVDAEVVHKGEYDKRAYYDNSTIDDVSSAPNKLFLHSNKQLCIAEKNGLKVFSQDGWNELNTSGHVPCKVRGESIFRADGGATGFDSAIVAGYICYVWSNVRTDVGYYMILEETTRAVVVPPTVIGTINHDIGVRATAGTHFIIYGFDDTSSTPTAYAATINTGSALPNLGAMLSLINTGNKIVGCSTPSDAAGVYVAVSESVSTQPNVMQLTASGTTVTKAANVNIDAGVSGVGNVFGIFHNAGLAKVFVAMLENTTLYVVAIDEDMTNDVYNSIGAWSGGLATITTRLSGGEMRIFFTDIPATDYKSVRWCNLDTDGALSGSIHTHYNLELISEAFETSDHQTYVWARVHYPGTLFGTLINTGKHWDRPTSVLVTPYTDEASVDRLKTVGVGFLDKTSSFTDNDTSNSVRGVVQTTDNYFHMARSTVENQGFLGGRTIEVAFDEGIISTTPANRLSLLGDGYVASLDRSLSAENSFITGPDGPFLPAGQSTSSGNNISWLVTWRWTDSEGNIHRSAPSPALTLDGKTQTGAFNLTLRSSLPPCSALLGVPHGSPLYGELWRDPGLYAAPPMTLTGIYSLVDTAVITPVVGTEWTFDLTDTGGDFSAEPTLYTDSGELASAPAPAPAFMVSDDRRVYIVDSENTGTVWFSKILQEGVAPEFSALLTIRIGSDAGPITGLALIDGKLVIFTETKIYHVAGSGPDNVGNGSFNLPREIPTDVGCSNGASIIADQRGVYFQSKAGFHILDRTLLVQFIGRPVLDSVPTVTDVTLIPDKTQIRWDISDVAGVTQLVYNYNVGTWTFFNHAATVSSVFFDDAHVTVSSDGTVYKQNNASYIDVPFEYTSPWIKLAGLQGFKRVFRAYILGTFGESSPTTPGTLTVEVFHDHIETVNETHTFTISSLPETDPFQIRVTLDKQKCQAVKFRIKHVVATGQDTTDTAFTLTGLGLEAGVDTSGQGMRLPTTQKG